MYMLMVSFLVVCKQHDQMYNDRAGVLRTQAPCAAENAFAQGPHAWRKKAAARELREAGKFCRHGVVLSKTASTTNETK